MVLLGLRRAGLGLWEQSSCLRSRLLAKGAGDI